MISRSGIGVLLKRKVLNSRSECLPKGALWDEGCGYIRIYTVLRSTFHFREGSWFAIVLRHCPSLTPFSLSLIVFFPFFPFPPLPFHFMATQAATALSPGREAEDSAFCPPLETSSQQYIDSLHSHKNLTFMVHMTGYHF